MSVSLTDMVDAVGGGDTDETDARGQPRLPRMSVSAFESLHYNMSHQSRGVAVIINNINFDENLNVPNPIGDNDKPSADVRIMFALLESLGFKDIRTYKDLNASKMRGLLQEVAKLDHTNSDCFVCVILTHGDDGFVLAKDDRIPVDELVYPFKGHLCTSLAGKPKLFLIQSSRGFMPEKYEVRLESAVEEEEAMDEETVRRIPTEADFLMAYSMIPAFRNTSQCSWFIQAIHDVFRQNWETKDLLTMITRVNKKVADLFESNAKDEFECHNRQIPYITSMLTKDVFFTKKTT